MLEQLRNTVDKVADIPNSHEQSLSVYYRGEAVDALVVPILTELRRRRPGFRANLMRSKRTGNTLVSLNLGEADIAILKCGPHPLTGPLKFHSLNCFTHLTCVLPAGHRLAGFPCIREKDLEDEALVLLESRSDTTQNQTLRNNLRYQWVHDELKERFPGRYALAPDNVAAVTLAKAGFGITLVDSSQATGGSGVSFSPFERNRLFEYGVFCHRHNVNPLVGEFLDVAGELYRTPFMFGPDSRLQPLDGFMAEHPGMRVDGDAAGG